MKNSVVNIGYDDEKLSAVRRYMKKKDTDLDTEMSAYLEKLYQKYVPAGVQEYIAERENDDAPTPVRRPKNIGGDGERFHKTEVGQE